MLKSAAAALILAGLAAGCTDSGPDLGVSAQPIAVVPGGTTCAAAGLGGQEFRIEAPQNGVYSIDANNTLLFQYYDDSHTSFFFTQSTIRMNGVLVHGGGYTAVWDIGGANGWPSLIVFNPQTGEDLPTEAASFCFDYELFLNPNGYAHYGQTQSWSIAKSGSSQSLLLSAGQTYLAPYTVTLTPTSVSTAGLFIEGPVFINNPTPLTPTIDALTVDVGGLPAIVTCPFAFPYVVPAYTTATCTFHVDVPDTSDRAIYVDVVSDGSILVDRSLETASFASHTTSTTTFDTCVAVFDDHVAGGFLGTACASEGVKTFSYLAEVGPFAVCGPFSVTNTAYFEGLDSGDGTSASFVVGGQVPCGGGCTLTQGYWKTHSAHGPAPYDDTWAQLPSGANTIFFLSGLSYYTTLWTPVGGNPYFQLAHQYIAAQLNGLNGASRPAAVTAAFDEATTLLQTYNQTSPELGKRLPLRDRFIYLAGILAAYNEGATGPGHCNE